MAANNNNDSLLNAQKGSGVARNEAFHKQEELQENIFSLILSSPEDFDIKDWIKDFSKFAKEYKKLLYAKISSKIIACEDNGVIENLTNNISTVIEAIKPKEKGVTAEDSIILVDKDCYTLFLKFHDHCNLAMTQRSVYLKTENEFKEIASETKDDVRKSLEEATTEINKHVKASEQKINDAEKNITTQLITLVSIFTALSFVIFGGISVLDNLLQNVRALPVIKTLLIGDLWFICMANLFIIFTKLICVMTDRNFKIKWYIIILNALLIIFLIAILVSGKCAYGTIFFV